MTLFNSDKNYIRATAVHEMAHVIHNMSCHTVMGMGQILYSFKEG